MALILASSSEVIDAFTPKNIDCSTFLSESSAMTKPSVTSWPPPWVERSKTSSYGTRRYNLMKASDKFYLFIFGHLNHGVYSDFSGWRFFCCGLQEGKTLSHMFAIYFIYPTTLNHTACHVSHPHGQRRISMRPSRS